MTHILIFSINLAALILYGYDKAMAVSHRWRMPERVLLGIGLVGGAWGALAGMILFRHKIRSIRFWFFLIPCALFYLWLAVTIW